MMADFRVAVQSPAGDEVVLQRGITYHVVDQAGKRELQSSVGGGAEPAFYLAKFLLSDDSVVELQSGHQTVLVQPAGASLPFHSFRLRGISQMNNSSAKSITLRPDDNICFDDSDSVFTVKYLPVQVEVRSSNTQAEEVKARPGPAARKKQKLTRGSTPQAIVQPGLIKETPTISRHRHITPPTTSPAESVYASALNQFVHLPSSPTPNMALPSRTMDGAADDNEEREVPMATKGGEVSDMYKSTTRRGATKEASSDDTKSTQGSNGTKDYKPDALPSDGPTTSSSGISHGGPPDNESYVENLDEDATLVADMGDKDATDSAEDATLVADEKLGGATNPAEEEVHGGLTLDNEDDPDKTLMDLVDDAIGVTIDHAHGTVNPADLSTLSTPFTTKAIKRKRRVVEDDDDDEDDWLEIPRGRKRGRSSYSHKALETPMKDIIRVDNAGSGFKSTSKSLSSTVTADNEASPLKELKAINGGQKNGKGLGEHKYTVVLTNSSLSENKRLLSFLTEHCVVEEVMTGETDVLIMGKFATTSKLLLGLVQGIRIVTDKWISASSRKGELLDPDEYLFSAEGQEDLPPGRFSSAVGAPLSDLFSGKTFHFTPVLKKSYGQGFADVKRICLAAGVAKVLSGPVKDLKASGKEDNLIFGLKTGDPDALTLQEKGHLVHDKKFITASILRGEIMDAHTLHVTGPAKGRKGAKPKK